MKRRGYQPGTQVGSTPCKVCGKFFRTNVAEWHHRKAKHGLDEEKEPCPKEDDWMGP